MEHYGQEPEKLEAARFLIRNMPHWYAYEGWQLDSVRQMLALRKLDKESIKKWKQVSFYSLPKVYDAQVITSNYLIENIDLAFKVWKKYPWNRSLDFDDFSNSSCLTALIMNLYHRGENFIMNIILPF